VEQEDGVDLANRALDPLRCTRPNNIEGNNIKPRILSYGIKPIIEV
jgi:hypothetical protein